MGSSQYKSCTLPRMAEWERRTYNLLIAILLLKTVEKATLCKENKVHCEMQVISTIFLKSVLPFKNIRYPLIFGTYPHLSAEAVYISAHE